jgi:hypothetical protein
MDRTHQRCVRILTALEDLAAQESAALAHGDFAALLALQDRAEPLVAFLASVDNGAVLRLGLSDRIVALRARREQTRRALGEKIDEARRELQATDATQRRVTQVVPVYGRVTVKRRQLLAVG